MTEVKQPQSPLCGAPLVGQSPPLVGLLSPSAALPLPPLFDGGLDDLPSPLSASSSSSSTHLKPNPPVKPDPPMASSASSVAKPSGATSHVQSAEAMPFNGEELNAAPNNNDNRNGGGRKRRKIQQSDTTRSVSSSLAPSSSSSSSTSSSSSSSSCPAAEQHSGQVLHAGELLSAILHCEVVMQDYIIRHPTRPLRKCAFIMYRAIAQAKQHPAWLTLLDEACTNPS
jgi:hypothetical protein